MRSLSFEFSVIDFGISNLKFQISDFGRRAKAGSPKPEAGLGTSDAKSFPPLSR
jgi:hypothetical protein